MPAPNSCVLGWVERRAGIPKTSHRILGKYQYAEWSDMRAHFTFNYTRDVDILIDLPWTEAGVALFADMHGFQLPG